jgi:hypothetical protein
VLCRTWLGRARAGAARTPRHMSGTRARSQRPPRGRRHRTRPRQPGFARTWPDAPGAIRPQLELARRIGTFDEVVGGLDERTAQFEARRCMSCSNCFECDNCCGVCPDNAVIKLGPVSGTRLTWITARAAASAPANARAAASRCTRSASEPRSAAPDRAVGHAATGLRSSADRDIPG